MGIVDGRIIEQITVIFGAVWYGYELSYFVWAIGELKPPDAIEIGSVAESEPRNLAYPRTSWLAIKSAIY